MIKYLLSLLLFITSMVNAQTVYKVSLFRAAPGELKTLIENLKERRVTYEKLGGDNERPINSDIEEVDKKGFWGGYSPRYYNIDPHGNKFTQAKV